MRRKTTRHRKWSECMKKKKVNGKMNGKITMLIVAKC